MLLCGKSRNMYVYTSGDESDKKVGILFWWLFHQNVIEVKLWLKEKVSLQTIEICKYKNYNERKKMSMASNESKSIFPESYPKKGLIIVTVVFD